MFSSKMIGFVMTRDSKRSREFYEGVLGFKFVSKDLFALVLRTEANLIRISEGRNFAPASHTILGWEVSAIERVAEYLEGRGVVFERYPWAAQAQDAQGIWTAPGGSKVAWFKDPDGNVLSISEH